MEKKNKTPRKDKTYKGEWYSINSILGNADWARFFLLLGGRETGKSYSVMRWAVNRKLKNKDNVKFYWLRLTDEQCNKLLENNAAKLVDPDLMEKYNLKLMRKGNTVYTYEEVIKTTKSGEEKKSKKNIQEFCTVLSCSTFYNTKGVGYFDNTFTGEYICVLDEMNREESERNSFDIVYNFTNLLENITRSVKTNIKIFMIGNTLQEASDLLSAFNFIPDNFGRYRLKSKRAVIDYIKPNEEYLKRRKGTNADILMPDASTFTNEVMIDRSLLVNKRLKNKPLSIIKFSKSKSAWFTLWNNNIIDYYNNEENKPVIAMKRYLDEVFNQGSYNAVVEMFDIRAFKFTNLSCFKQFEKQMKLLKK